MMARERLRELFIRSAKRIFCFLSLGQHLAWRGALVHFFLVFLRYFPIFLYDTLPIWAAIAQSV